MSDDLMAETSVGLDWRIGRSVVPWKKTPSQLSQRPLITTTTRWRMALQYRHLPLQGSAECMHRYLCLSNCDLLLALEAGAAPDSNLNV
jgi:hypothetical protein